MSDDEMNWSLLDRYLSGRCSAEEITAMQQWATLDPSNARLLASVQRIWDESGRITERFDAETAIRALRSTRDTEGVSVEKIVAPTLDLSRDPGESDGAGRAWERVDGRLLAERKHSRGERTRVSPFARAFGQLSSRNGGWGRGRMATWSLVVPGRRRPIWMFAAAAVALLAGSALLRSRLGAPGSSRAASTIAAHREFTTRRAQVAQVQLSDGSTITLAPESRLTVPADYGLKRRDITVEGEGFIAAVHDATLPFVVHSGSAMVRDIGTKFVVRHYAGDLEVRVAVSEGSVRLGTQGLQHATGSLLVRGDVGRLDQRGAIAITHGVDLERYIGWTSGRLTFSDAPLEDVVTQLERWYDVRLVLADSSLKQRRLTVSVPRVSIDALVDAIVGALDLRAERSGDVIVLRAKKK